MLCLASPNFLGAQSDTRTVTDHYLELTLNQQYDELLHVYSPEAIFVDYTGDVFQGPVSQGAVRGAEAIVNMQKGWGLDRARLERRLDFTVGEYSVYWGTYFAGYSNQPDDISIPFMTALRARDGQIVERTDFGEYIQSFRLGDAFDANTANTAEVAPLYLQAYLDEDFETQQELLAPDAKFQDPTSQVFGPPAGSLFEGADAIIERRRAVFQNVSDFDLEIQESFVANHHAVYMGTVRYTVASGRSFAQSAVFIIEVKDGKVTRHWDFVDYSQ